MFLNKPLLTYGILFSTAPPIFVLKAALFAKPLLSGILLSTYIVTPMFVSSASSSH